MKKFMLRVMPIVLVALLIVGNVFAIDVVEPNAGQADSSITGVASKIWGTVTTIVQILAVAAVVIASVRYMFASADQKADINNQKKVLEVGDCLVIAAVPFLTFVQKVARNIFKN